MLSTRTNVVRNRMGALLIFAAGLICSAPASAIIIDITPMPEIAEVGDQVAIDLFASDFKPDEAITAFDLDFGYDATILTFIDAIFSSELGTSLTDVVSTAGNTNIAEVSLELDAELLLSQPSSFSLATLRFDVIGNGLSNLTLLTDRFGFIDVKGNNAAVLPVTVREAQISVGQPSPVPEPNVLMLLLAGGLGLFAIRLRRHSRSIVS